MMRYILIGLFIINVLGAAVVAVLTFYLLTSNAVSALSRAL